MDIINSDTGEVVNVDGAKSMQMSLNDVIRYDRSNGVYMINNKNYHRFVKNVEFDNVISYIKNYQLQYIKELINNKNHKITNNLISIYGKNYTIKIYDNDNIDFFARYDGREIIYKRIKGVKNIFKDIKVREGDHPNENTPMGTKVKYVGRSFEIGGNMGILGRYVGNNEFFVLFNDGRLKIRIKTKDLIIA